MSLSRMFARPLIAAGILYGAQNALRHTDDLAPKAATVTDKVVPAAKKAVPQARVIPDDPATLVRINAGVQIAASLALATGRAHLLHRHRTLSVWPSGPRQTMPPLSVEIDTVP